MAIPSAIMAIPLAIKAIRSVREVEVSRGVARLTSLKLLRGLICSRVQVAVASKNKNKGLVSRGAEKKLAIKIVLSGSWSMCAVCTCGILISGLPH